MNNKWDRMIQKWYRFKRSDKKLDKFFEHHIPHFWKNLTLIEVIEIALKSEIAANTAYVWNYANFRTFCENTWKTKILDCRKFQNLQIEQFKLIQDTFDVNTVILPGNIPRNILCHMYKGYNLIFYTSRKQYDGLPLLRPQTTAYKSINLTINGSHNFYLTDPTNEILLTYQDIRKLTLNSICFTNEKIGILHSIRFYQLILNNCLILGPYDKNLAKCIVQRGKFLHEIVIGFQSNNWPMSQVINYIIQNIQEMNLYTLKISMRKTKENLKILDNLKNAPNIRELSLTIYTTQNKSLVKIDEMEDKEFINRLKYLKMRSVEIQKYKYLTPDWEENNWYF